MIKPAKRLPVVGPCPQTAVGEPTHAVMSQRQLNRFRGQLIYWCSRCNAAHVAQGGELRLSHVEASPTASAVDVRARESPLA